MLMYQGLEHNIAKNRKKKKNKKKHFIWINELVQFYKINK